MKKLLVSVLAIAGLVACSQDTTLVQNSNSGTLMEFNVAALDNATRVDPSITSTTLDAFDIWAYVDSEAGTVLTKERVSRNGNMWSYVNKQYWTPEHTYYFNAIAPVDTNHWTYNLNDVNKGEDNTIAFTNVDGTEDLIYAHEEVTTPKELGQYMDAVGLQFNHLLSKVKFTFKNGFTTNNVYVAVENVEMDAPAAGTYTTTNGTWALENGTTTLVFGDVTDGETLDIDGTTVFAAQKSVRAADERFTIPAGAGQNYVVRFTVKHYNGNVCLSESNKIVNISGLNLENGKAYNFVTEINEQNAADAELLPIEFEVECVNDWNHTDVDSAEAFANALKAETSSINVTLTQDIDVAISSLGTITGGSGEYKLGGEGTEAITIDLNGHTLNITTTYWSVLGAKNADAVFTIKNGTMTSSQPTGTWNSYDLGFANCNYNFENVVFEDAGIFSIGLDAHFAGEALKDGSRWFSGALVGWKDLAKTSYGAKITLKTDVRLYSWKSIDDIDSSTLMENNLTSNDTSNQMFVNMKFDVKALVKSAASTNAQYSDILYNYGGVDYVHAGIAFFGGGKNYSVVENLITSDFNHKFTEYNVKLSELVDDKGQNQGYLQTAAGNEPFYFLIYNKNSTFTYQTQLNMTDKYSCLYN